MKSAQSYVGYLAIALFVCLASLEPVRAADADPLTDFAPNATEFVFRDVFKNGAVSDGPGGLRAALNIEIFPALTSQGITYVHFKMLPCGENLPHSHPRATELLTMISGGPLQAGFVDTKGVPHIYLLNPGDIVIFPRGLLHFELNVGNETAFFISALNSQNPGVLSAVGALLNLPDRAAASALNQDLETVAKLKKRIYAQSDQLQMDTKSGCLQGVDLTTTF